jgi:hypothetical protein
MDDGYLRRVFGVKCGKLHLLTLVATFLDGRKLHDQRGGRPFRDSLVPEKVFSAFIHLTEYSATAIRLIRRK